MLVLFLFAGWRVGVVLHAHAVSFLCVLVLCVLFLVVFLVWRGVSSCPRQGSR